MCSYVLHTCTWEYMLSLTTGWTWETELCSLVYTRLLDLVSLTQSSQQPDLQPCGRAVSGLPWIMATQPQGRDGPWGSLGTWVPSSSLTHKLLLKLSSSFSPCQILCIFLDSIKCRFLVCQLWVREMYTSMSVALTICFCCPTTWLVWISALVYGLAYVIPVSFSSTAEFSKKRVQGRTAFSCK